MSLVRSLGDLDGRTNKIPVAPDMTASAATPTSSPATEPSAASAAVAALAGMGGAGEAGRHEAGETAGGRDTGIAADLPAAASKAQVAAFTHKDTTVIQHHPNTRQS